MCGPFLLLLVACSDKSNEPEYFETTAVQAEPVDEITEDSASPEVDDLPDDEPIDDACDGADPAPSYPEGTVDCIGGTCRVPEGKFYMGFHLGHADECPARILTLPEFRIDQTEVTWAAYQTCVDAGTCSSIPAYCNAWAESLADGNPSDLPVTCVTWHQATTFCGYRGGRLPSEAEWEKAARGTQGAWWPWGTATPTCDFSNFRFVSWYCEEGVIAVGSYENESPFGPVDMTGNAWEWVDDYYDAEWYREAPGTDGPTANCRTTVGSPPGECRERVMRGGAYNVTEFNTRNSARTAAEPDRVDNNIGFRCAYDG